MFSRILIKNESQGWTKYNLRYKKHLYLKDNMNSRLELDVDAGKRYVLVGVEL